MTIAFRLAAEDLVAFSEHVAFAREGNRLRARAVWSGVTVAILTSIFLYSELHEPISSVIVGMIIGTVTALSLPSVWKDSFRKRALKLYTSNRDSSIGDHNVAFDETGLHHSCCSGSGTIAWSAVNSVEFTARYLFLFLGPAKAVIIPRAAIADPAAIESELRDLANGPFVGTWRAEAAGYAHA